MKIATLCYVKDKKNKKTLMIHRVKKNNDFHEGKWNGLGGKFEIGESPEECVIREVKEESGLVITTPKMKGFITFPNFDGTNDWHVFLFIAENFTNELIDSSEGNLKWIDDGELLNLNLWDGDKIFLNWMEQEKFFSAKFNYLDGKLIDYIVNFY
ncbi:MAG: DNA mismatch repair protein MutT [Chlorobiaceae bacterium]|nr:DNA mismatch repair protein MutT [Chlorobiaceae bacterium]MBA4309397.1 DNA mismatch repair protein MutT [Chlorobiaceae bacterium]